MIVSASYRTDIPAFYADWFARRLEAGWCLVPGPFDGRLRRVPLAGPEVSGFVFWTRHVTPALPSLERLAAAGVPFCVSYTILGYPRALEAATPPPEPAVAAARVVAERFGPGVLVWRYDPILLTSLTDADWHRARFARLAAQLAGATDEVVISFAAMYRKTERNLGAAAAEHGFELLRPTDTEQQALALELTELAAREGMSLALCSQRHLLRDRLRDAACIDSARLSRVAGRPVTAASKPHRPACGCAQSVDIGAYETCPFGCAYCYAVSSRAAAQRARLAHRPDDPLLQRPARWAGLSAAELEALAERDPASPR